jgi:D-glycero-D-manno-heptose 1,7-bisphosphate phosphatase
MRRGRHHLHRRNLDAGMIPDVLVQPESNLTRYCTLLLDRDGVINQKMPEGEYVRSVKDLRVLPGVPAAIARLNQAGIRVLVLSNQRGIALGLYTSEDVESIHRALQEHLATHGAHVDAFFFCSHDKGECRCRKPLPGLYEQALERFPEITPATSAMIGDSCSDIEFGKALGMHTIWIEGDAESRKPGSEAAAALADRQFATLSEAVNALLT